MTYIMDPGPMRYRLLNKTNGFLFSLPITDEIKETYDLESVIMNDVDVAVYAIFPKNSPKKQLIREYLNYCTTYHNRTHTRVPLISK